MKLAKYPKPSLIILGITNFLVFLVMLDYGYHQQRIPFLWLFFWLLSVAFFVFAYNKSIKKVKI